MAAVAAAPAEEAVHHLRDTGWPIVTMLERPPLDGVVVVPFDDPVPLYPWLMVHRRSLRHPALDALNQAVTMLAEQEDWRALPTSHWLADADRAQPFTRDQGRALPRA